MSDDDYCNNCKVKIMDGTCFCDWEAEEPSYEDIWFPRSSPEYRTKRRAKREAAEDFKSKLSSISFSRVKGLGRG